MNKKGQKLISLLLAVAMVLSLTPISAFSAGFEAEQCQPTENNDSHGAHLHLGDNDDGEYNYNIGNDENYHLEGKYEEKQEEALPIFAGMTPAYGFFNATIEHGSNTVPFGLGNRFERPMLAQLDQRLNISEVFGDGSGVIVIEINNGIRLGTVVPGFTGTGHNRTFNPTNLPLHLQGVVTGGRWIRSPEIVQNITGNRFQPLSGTLIYTIAPNSGVVLTPHVNCDYAFLVGAIDQVFSNAITVSSFENVGIIGSNLDTLSDDEIFAQLNAATPRGTVELAEYVLIGQARPFLNASNNWPSALERPFAIGEEWTNRINLFSFRYGGVATADRFLVEEIVFTIRLHPDLGVQGVRALGAITPAMFSYSIDRSGNDDLVTIRFVQPNTVGGPHFEVFGEISQNATVGALRPTMSLVAGQTLVTGLQGTPLTSITTSGIQQIRITRQGPNRLTITAPAAASRLSPTLTDGFFTPLASFTVQNEFDLPLENQAIRMFFTDPSVGVQALRLPSGSQGIINMYAHTTMGNTITALSGVLPSTNVSGTFPGTDVNFYPFLQPGEFITELYFELYGNVAVGARAGLEGSSLATFQRDLIDQGFLVLGQILDTNAAPFEISLIAGETDPNAQHGIVENLPETLPNAQSRLREEVTSSVTFANPTDPANSVFRYVNRSGTPLNLQLMAGTPAQRVGHEFGRYSGGSGGLAPAALQGHYIYLRNIAGLVEIDFSSISVEWGTNTWQANDGSLNIDTITDSTGSRVYRLSLPDVVLGSFDRNVEPYPNVRVTFYMRAIHSARTQILSRCQIVFIAPMSDLILTGGPFTHHRLPDFDVDHRANSSRWVGAATTPAINLIESAQVLTWTEAALTGTTDTLSTPWSLYDWSSGSTVLNLAPDSGVSYRFNVFNGTGAAAGGFVTLIPIPKQGEIVPNTVWNSGMNEQFKFSLNFLGFPSENPAFSVTFATTYVVDYNSAAFVPLGQISDMTQIRMIRIENIIPVQPLQEQNLVFNLEVPGNVNAREIAGEINRNTTNSRVAVLGTTSNRPGSPAALRMWNFVDFNWNYENSINRPDGGIFRETPVAHLSTVAAPTSAPERLGYTFEGWTTDQAGEYPWDFSSPITVPILNLYAQWSTHEYDVSYTFTGTLPPADLLPTLPDTLSHQVGQPVSVAPPFTQVIIGTNPADEGALYGRIGEWTFNGWTPASGLEVSDVIGTAPNQTFIMPAGHVEFTGTWTFTPASGGTPPGDSTPPGDDTPPGDGTPPSGGTPPGGGTTGGGTPTTQLPDPQLPLTQTPDISEVFATYHNAFMIGGPDGTIRPHGNITRAEVVTILFRLLSDDFRAQVWSQDNDFADVNADSWFNNAVSTMTNAGIISEGYMFRPNDAVTRAEFAAMVARFFSAFTATENAFSDIDGNWAENYINLVAQFGWVQGSGDGTFNPNANMTRAEAAAIVTRMLDRELTGHDGLLDGRTRWPDKRNTNAWYYLYLQEATHSTLFERLEDNTIAWIKILPHLDWTVLEKANSNPGAITAARQIQMDAA